MLVNFLSSYREYNEGGSPAEGGEGSSQPQDLTPQQQHQQYLGESRPELVQFPDIQWAGMPIPGKARGGCDGRQSYPVCKAKKGSINYNCPLSQRNIIITANLLH